MLKFLKIDKKWPKDNQPASAGGGQTRLDANYMTASAADWARPHLRIIH